MLQDPSLAPLVIATAASSLPSPPTVYGILPAWWYRTVDLGGTIGEFDLDIWGNASATLEDATILAAIPHPLVYADNALTSVDATANTLTKNGHGLATGDGPIQLTTTGTLPGGLGLATDYWVIRASANAIQLALSLVDALAGTAIDLTSAGSGTHTIVDTASTKRVWWHSYGTLPAEIALDAQVGYSTRVLHRAAAVAYAVAGSLSAGVVNASITPVITKEL